MTTDPRLEEFRKEAKFIEAKRQMYNDIFNRIHEYMTEIKYEIGETTTVSDVIFTVGRLFGEIYKDNFEE